VVLGVKVIILLLQLISVFENAPIEKYVIINSKKVITEKEHKTLFEEYKKIGFQGTKGLADTCRIIP
jgi:hypothetical protein